MSNIWTLKEGLIVVEKAQGGWVVPSMCILRHEIFSCNQVLMELLGKTKSVEASVDYEVLIGMCSMRYLKSMRRVQMRRCHTNANGING